MNELLASAPDASWEEIAPQLDAALGELSEQDRDAILLRYFEKKTAAEIAARLGTSAEAAQKRVSRAVERLREFFAKRGVTVGAGGLVVVISANAVQAAPAGMAVTISVAALAGTAASTAPFVATTKAIAMTTLQKTLVTATVAVLAGAGIYQTRHAARLRDQVQTLQQQQMPMSGQLQELQKNFADATNRLAGLLAANSEQISDANPPELLKLRGEVAVLRRQLAVAQSELQTSSIGFGKMLSDPSMRRYILQTEVNTIRVNFKDLFKELKLTPEQTEQAVQVMSQLFAKNVDELYAIPQGSLSPDEIAKATENRWITLKNQMLPLLGEAGTARLREYIEEIPAHGIVELLNGRLGANQLSDQQNNQLLQLVKSEPYDLTRGVSGDWDPAFWGPQPSIDDHLVQITESNQRILQQASGFLTADQVTELSLVLFNSITERMAQADAMIRK